MASEVMATSGVVWQGGCLCGNTRFQVTGQPLALLYCHCRMCQRAAGAPVVAWATFPQAGFAWTGSPPRIYRSSPQARRWFCADCGSPLAFQADAEPDRLDLATACFDRPDLLPPDHHVWVSSQQPWLHQSDGLPRHSRDSAS